MADIVTPTPGVAAGSLQGTMTAPTPTPTPTAGAVPTPVQPGLPAQPQMPTGNGNSNPFALAQVMQALQGKVNTNNALMTQRNLLLKHLYNEPLTDQEKQTLDPTLLNAVNSNNRNQIDLSLRLIGDEIGGRKNTLDQSVQYLTSAYNTAIQQAEEQRQNAIGNVLNFAQTYGAEAKNALASLYGQEYVDQLKDMGVDLDKFVGLETLAEKNAKRASAGSGSGTLAGSYIVDSATDNAVRNLIASKPGDGLYGDAYNAVKAKFGQAVADKYDRVYQSVFNEGASLDAAFNNAKLGSSAPGGLVDANGKAVKLSPAMQSTVADWNTLSDLADQTLALGNQLNFSGTGGGFQGSIAQFMAKNFGAGTEDEEKLRNLITNIKGTLAKARGGTSFTPNEQKLLDSYTPGINDSPTVLKAKLSSLQSFIDTTLGNIYESAGAVNNPAKSPSGGGSSGQSLKDQVRSKGYDFDKLKADGYSDADIKKAVGL